MACLLTIGLPVFNGGHHLKEVLESLLAQTFEDFHLIISDNGSTDKTSEICRRFQKQDSRITLLRQDENLGASRNFNLLFRAGEPTPYFKWAAADDLYATEFLARCIQLLEECPDRHLAFTQYQLIDAEGKVMESIVPDWAWPHRLCTDNPVHRFEDSLVDLNGCRHIFGVFRRAVLKQAPLIKPFAGSDRGFLARLALRFPLVEVPESLFFSRRDEFCATKQFEDDSRLWTEWFDPKKGKRSGFPRWKLWFMDAGSVLTAPISWREKKECWELLVKRTIRDPYMGPKLREDFIQGLRPW